MLALRDGEVDADLPAVDLRVAHRVFGGFRVLHGIEVDETETAGSSRLQERERNLSTLAIISQHNGLHLFRLRCECDITKMIKIR